MKRQIFGNDPGSRKERAMRHLRCCAALVMTTALMLAAPGVPWAAEPESLPQKTFDVRVEGGVVDVTFALALSEVSSYPVTITAISGPVEELLWDGTLTEGVYQLRAPLTKISSGAIKVVAGRSRPRLNTDSAANFKLMRGFKDDDYRSFPSGHTTAAFAFASLVSAETSHWWPNSRWIIGPIVYGGAALTGVSRIYNNAHWASDVIAGAAIGTLTGIKVFRYQHSHPDNRLDKFFLRAGMQMSNNGVVMPIMSMVQR